MVIPYHCVFHCYELARNIETAAVEAVVAALDGTVLYDEQSVNSEYITIQSRRSKAAVDRITVHIDSSLYVLGYCQISVAV